MVHAWFLVCQYSFPDLGNEVIPRLFNEQRSFAFPVQTEEHDGRDSMTAMGDAAAQH